MTDAGEARIRRTGQTRRSRLGSGAYGPARRLFNVMRAAGLALFCLLLPIAAPAEAATKLVALGDSLTAGLGLPPEESFPVRLQAALAADGHPVEVINGGVSGDTTAGGLARLDWSLADHPDFALVEFGANDALRGLDPAETRANLDRILARLQAAHVKVLFCGMKALSNWGPDYTDKFEAIYPDLAKKYDAPLYPFFLDGVALDPALNQADMLHPNAKGVEVIVKRLLPAVEKLIGPGS